MTVFMSLYEKIHKANTGDHVSKQETSFNFDRYHILSAIPWDVRQDGKNYISRMIRASISRKILICYSKGYCTSNSSKNTPRQKVGREIRGQ